MEEYRCTSSCGPRTGRVEIVRHFFGLGAVDHSFGPSPCNVGKLSRETSSTSSNRSARLCRNPPATAARGRMVPARRCDTATVQLRITEEGGAAGFCISKIFATSREQRFWSPGCWSLPPSSLEFPPLSTSGSAHCSSCFHFFGNVFLRPTIS